MQLFKNRYFQLGLGLLVLAAILRTGSAFLISNLASTVSIGVAAERDASSVIADVLAFIVNIATPLGAAFIAGAVLISEDSGWLRRTESEAS